MTLYFLCLCKEKKTLGRFQLEAPIAYKCKQILGLCQCFKMKYTWITSSLQFLPSTQGFFCKSGSHRILFPETHWLFNHGASGISQVSMCSLCRFSQEYCLFKYFYLIQIWTEYIPVVTKEKYTRYLQKCYVSHKRYPTHVLFFREHIQLMFYLA